MNLQTKKLGATFGGVVALAEADLTLTRGQVLAVIGPNGSGKSTLFNCITGFVPLSSGSVLVDDVDITGQPAHLRIRRGVARTFQTPRIDVEPTVLTTVLCGFLSTMRSLPGCVLGLAGTRRDELRARADAMALLDNFGLADLAETAMGELPLGQVRLVDVVRAIAMRPNYLLLDEPAAGLAAAEQEMLSGEIRRIAADGMGVMLVEHNFELVRALADEVVVLQQGRVLMAGAPETVANDPRVMDAYLGKAHTANATGKSGTADSASTKAAGGPSVRSADVVLACRGLNVSYGRAGVCSRIDLSVRAGRLTALLGSNGAGKSTLLAALAGVHIGGRRWVGEVSLDDVRIERLGASQRAVAGVAFVPEGRGNIFAGLTVEENLQLGLRQLAHSERESTLDSIIEVFPPLAALQGARAGILSGGEQQMVAIAMALARRPKVLMLDEPSQGLAPAVLDVLVDAFEKLLERDLAILLAEQNQAFAAALADDFLVLAHGEVVVVGNSSDLARRDEIAAAYL